MRPVVSVIMLVYNSEDYLDEAIQSVLQQETAVELIIVDDGSTDWSSRIAQRYIDQFGLSHGSEGLSEDREAPYLGSSIRYIRQDNKGVAAARNLGIASASCELLAFIDGDDLWTAGKLKKQIDALADRPEIACVIGKVQRFFDKISPQHCDETTRTNNTSASKIFYGDPHFIYGFGSSLIRRNVFEVVGKVDESLTLSEDTEWFVRLRERFRLEKMDFVSLLYRTHAGSMTFGKGFEQMKVHSILKQSLDRRRAGKDQAGPLI